MAGPRAYRPKSAGVVGTGVPVAIERQELVANLVEEILLKPGSAPVVFPTDTDETIYYPEHALG